MTAVSDSHIKEANRRRSKAMLGDKNPMWKSDKVGYNALHQWVNSRLPKPQTCQRCFNGPAYDLTNITGRYTRDLTNWKYLCRRCHMWFDGRLQARDKGKFVSPKRMKVYSPLLSQYKKHLRAHSRSHSRSGSGEIK